RQEPSRRPRRASADRTWLRRILRQSLSSQCRGGAGEPRLSEGSGVPEEIWAARRVAFLCRWEDRQYRTAYDQTHGDGRRGISRRRKGFHQPAAQGGQAVVLLLQFDPDAHLHASEKGIGRQDRTWLISRRHGRA